MFTHILGIDVAGKDFRVCLKIRATNGSVKIKGSRKFSNTSTGFESLTKWVAIKGVSDAPIRVVMEATGVYYESLAYFLHEQGWQIFVLLPNRIKGYFKFHNQKTKTDKIEAQGLAELGISQELPSWESASPQMYSIKRLSRERNTLIEEKTVISNRLHAEKSYKSPDRRTMRRLNQQLRLIDRQVKEVEQDLGQSLEQDRSLNSGSSRFAKSRG